LSIRCSGKANWLNWFLTTRGGRAWHHEEEVPLHESVDHNGPTVAYCCLLSLL
jgi:hypothetical protein